MRDLSPSSPPLFDWPAVFGGLHQAEQIARGEVPGTRERLERARGLIHAQLDEPLDLDRLAKAAHFSRYHFAREFRREFGVTPHQYLTQRRLERAQQLLLTSDRSVTEVCMEVGFSSLGSFSTLFQRHIGHSPQRYRRRVFVVPNMPRPVVLMIPGCFLAKYAAL